ncbi:MAG: EamA family transporter [Chroococcales cyanobacterium]
MTLVDSWGALFYSKGMKEVEEISTLNPRELLKIAKHAFQNAHLLIGIALEACNFFLFLMLLSWADLSLIIPLGSLSYLVSILGAKFWLKEDVTKERWIGTLLIMIGVVLVSID